MHDNIPARDITPLTGKWLIEASAGTGKTWTLTGLLLRLLLETDHHPREIIATTFTRKAAAEMRNRTNARFESFLQLCKAIAQEYQQHHELFDSPIEEKLSTLLDTWKATEHHPQQAAASDIVNRKILQDAATQGIDAVIALFRRVDRRRDEIDELFIGTLDSLCQRWLKEFALETGSSQRELLDDETEVVTSLVHNELRRILAQADEETAELIVNHLNLTTIVTAITNALNFSDAPIETFYSPLESSLQHYHQALASPEHQRAMQQFQQLSQDSGDGLIEVLTHLPEKAWNGKKKPLKKEIFDFLQKLKTIEYNQMGFTFLLENYPKAIETLFTQPKAIFNKAHQAEAEAHIQAQHLTPIFQTLYHTQGSAQFALQRARDQHENYQYAKLLITLYQHVRHELPNYLEQQGQSSFSEQINRLNRALNAEKNGQLARYICHRYPIILVDESQDLNGAQAKLLENLYLQHLEPHGFLLLVGDPKQAIYHFRGGDVANYLRLKAQFPDEHICTLSQNFRSSPQMVASLNALYDQTTETRALGQGIYYETLQAAKTAGEIVHADGSTITCPIHWYDVEKADEEFLWILTLIQQLTSQQSPYARRLADGRLQAIARGDIMVLFSAHDKLATLQQQLQAHGIDTAYAAKQNIFTQEVAKVLHLLLQAFLRPQDKALQRRLLSSIFFGKTQAALKQLDDIATGKQQATAEQLTYEALSEHLQKGGENWQKGRLLSALQEFCTARLDAGMSIWQRLASQPSPQRERNLLDLRQLQRIIAEHGNHRLPSHFLQWWESLLNTPPQNDWAKATPIPGEDRVRLMTIHAAKGLESPIVILASSQESTKGFGDIYAYHVEGQTLLSSRPTESGDARYEQLKQERQSESARLLYVALTRAADLLFIGKRSRSPAQALSTLSQSLPLTQATGHQHLNTPTLLPKSEQSLPAIDTKAQPDDAQDQPYPQRYFTGWRKTSFTALARDSVQQENHLDIALPDYAADLSEEVPTLTTPLPYALCFPRGATAGSFLHELLEKTDARDIAKQPELPQPLRIHLRRLLEKYGLDAAQRPEEPIDEMALYHWLRDIVTTPLQPSGICLADIDPAQRSNEMSFILAANKNTPLDISAINALMRRWKKPIVLHDQEAIIGFLRGEIDLCYQYHGRYHVLDYKSNHLGDTREAYHSNALTQAMDEHYYWLQALIYQTAIHRWLQQRLPQYHAEKHLAPVNYYFLRGGAQGQLSIPIPLDILYRFDEIIAGTSTVETKMPRQT